MIYADVFGYKTSKKGLETAEDINEEKTYENILVGFIQVEEKDEENAAYVETKLVKNLKWAARKNETDKILLHSFNHLSESKAEPGFSKGLFDRAEERLKNAGYETAQTPFGYFLDLNLKAPGYPLARLFKDI